MTKKINKKLEEDDTYSFGEFPVSFQPPRGGTFTIEILDGIMTPSQFSAAIQVLNAVTEDHQIIIDLQCRGGSLDAADRFIHAMRDCKAPIHAIATGGVHSAATLILLECHSFELSQGFNALVHCGSLGNGGNFNEYVRKAEFDIIHMKKYLESAYKYFLTEEELEGLFKGQDLWIDAKEWVRRHEARNTALKEKLEAAMKKPRRKKVVQSEE
jgi:ATP-dependent protease ClpP protease subunit